MAATDGGAVTRARRLVAIATAAAMASAAVVSYLVLRGTNGHGSASATDTSAWRRLAHPVSFRYPPTWNEHPWISLGSMGNTTLVYLSSRALVQPCHHSSNVAHTVESGGCDEFAATHLHSGDIVVTWSEHGFFGRGRPLRLMPGIATLVNGHPARIAITSASTGCRRIDGRTSIEAVVVPAHFRDEIYAMDACIAAGPASSQAAQVLASLHTYR